MRTRFTIALAFTLALTAVPVAANTSGTMYISTDTTLTEDHDGRIEIVANNVTLDCAGHVVQGPGGGSDAGILVFGRDNAAVVNCDVRDFHIGIHVEGSLGTRLEGNSVSGNPQNGILLIRGANDSIVSDNLITGNANEGLTVVESSGNLIDGNVIDDSNKGMYLGKSDQNTVSNNVVTRGWLWFTIGLGEGSDDNVVTRNRVSITGIGILVDNSTGNLISQNEASLADSGIGLFAGSGGNHVEGNYSSSNRHNGFSAADGSTGNTFSNNLAHDNDNWGFEDTTGGNDYSSNSCVLNTLGSSSPQGLCDPAGSFTDDDGNTFEVDIEWMKWMGITLGCNPEGTLYCPFDAVTRAQMASFLVRALDLPAVSGNRFLDVSGTHAANINALAEAGVTLGCNSEGTLFCPDDFVTRAQMGSFLARALDLAPIPGDRFADVTGPHEPNINAIAEAGITLGCNSAGTLYCPADFVTRGQMAAFLHRALG